MRQLYTEKLQMANERDPASISNILAAFQSFAQAEALY
jgi:hypothetical protein